MNASLHISNFGDHRTKELLGRAAALEQEAADLRLEVEWRRRVAENVRRRNAAKVDHIVAELLASDYLEISSHD